MKGVLKYLCLVLFVTAISNVCVAANNPSATFIAISDLHFDPFTSCQPNASCKVIKELDTATVSEWESILRKLDVLPQQYKQDTNFTFLNSTLDEVQQVTLSEKPNFILVLGDFLGHQYKKKYFQYAQEKTEAAYQNFVKKTLEFETQQIAKRFPTTNVYMVSGNNDSYTDDNEYQPEGQFFQDMSMRWSILIKDSKAKLQMKTGFATSGYYAVNISDQPKLELVVLNSNLFSPYAHGNNIPAAANKEWLWLASQLHNAELKKHKVILAMHTPVGIDVYASLKQTPFSIVEQWNPKNTERFEELLQQYSTSISAVLASHIHSDWFQMFHATQKDIPFIGIPSITPSNKNNPSFKVFTYNTSSFEINNFNKYVYPLGSSREWETEYSFNSVYQPTCPHCQIIEGMKLLQKSGYLAEQYKLHYDSGTGTDLIQNNYAPYYWCQMNAMSATQYQQCLDLQ